LFGLPIHTAIGTSLAVDVIASIIVSIVYYRMGNVELRSGLGLALGAVVGAQVGSRIAKYIPSANLGRGFGMFLVIIGAGSARASTELGKGEAEWITVNAPDGSGIIYTRLGQIGYLAVLFNKDTRLGVLLYTLRDIKKKLETAH
jgi:uncharacterized membrane protein YfcA